MSTFYKLVSFAAFILASFTGNTQTIVKGRLIDAITKEPVYGASIHCTDPGCTCGCLTTATGEFEIVCKDCKTLSISSIGYVNQMIYVDKASSTILFAPSSSILNEVVVTASRGETVKRSQAPVAISTINTKLIQDTKATTADQLLNKVSGVNMV